MERARPAWGSFLLCREFALIADANPLTAAHGEPGHGLHMVPSQRHEVSRMA